MYDRRKRDDAKMEKLGLEGEKLVKAIYEIMGHTVILSEDKYDSEKDMLIDGQTCEVKTQIPVITQNCMAIKTNQYYKCINADILLFVEIPYSNRYGVNETVNIYQAKIRDSSNSLWIPWRSADGRDMMLYPISKLTLIESIQNEEICKRFADLSNSQV